MFKPARFSKPVKLFHDVRFQFSTGKYAPKTAVFLFSTFRHPARRPRRSGGDVALERHFARNFGRKNAQLLASGGFAGALPDTFWQFRRRSAVGKWARFRGFVAPGIWPKLDEHVRRGTPGNARGVARTVPKRLKTRLNYDFKLPCFCHSGGIRPNLVLLWFPLFFS